MALGATSTGASISQLEGAPFGTRCSANGEATLTCVYQGAGASLTPACVAQRQREIQARALHLTASSTTTNNANADYGCENNGWSLSSKSSSTVYLYAQLDWFSASGYYCYSFIGETGSQNYFDYDDQWGADLRVWVCGRFNNTYSGSGIGPNAFTDTPNFFYGNCGPQTDDSGSYAYIDYVHHYFPYVKF
jgi:hypothetical protein